MGVLLVNGMAEGERRAKELAAKYEAEFASRKCANGTMVFEVNYDAKYVEAVLAFKASKRLAARTYSISSRRLFAIGLTVPLLRSLPCQLSLWCCGYCLSW